MPTLKYYAAIEAAQAATKRDGIDLAVPFSIDALGTDSAWSRITHALFDLAIGIAFRFFRRFWPIAKFGRLIIVSRAEDVSAVLSRPDLYETPFGPEMTELAGGANFVLGLEGAEHDWQRQLVIEVVRRDDVAALGEKAASMARALIGNSKGRIDAMKDLFTRVSSEVCCSYFGLSTADPDAFADWTLAISALLFADPFGQAQTRSLALKGAAGVRAAIDLSLAAPRRSGDDTLVGRLLARKAGDPTLTNARIKAVLVGLTTGLIPTTTLAAGRIFQELTRRPNALAAARTAAIAGDERKLEAVLFEAARLNPALSPGQWRYARKEGIIATGQRREIRVPVGSVILVGTASALVDGRRTPNPYAFDPGRPPESFGLAFGEGTHDCLGKWVAMRLITKISGELLVLADLKPVVGTFGSLGWVGPFPRRLEFEFAPVSGPVGFSMPTICIPLSPSVSAGAIRAAVAAMGNPANGDIKAAVDGLGGIHFLSASVLEFGSKAAPRPNLVVEINGDGDAASVIARASRALEPWLAPIVSDATGSRAPLADQLNRHAIELKTRPFGAIGLDYPGLGEFSVPDIERQSKLADFAHNAIAAFTSRRLAPGGRALDALAFVRGLIRSDPALDPVINSDGELEQLAERGKAFAPDLLLPSRRRLALMDWTAPSAAGVLCAILRDPADLTALKVVFAVLSLLTAIWAGSNFGALSEHSTWVWSAIVVARCLGALALGIIVAALLFVLAAGLAVLWLRQLETADIPDDREPSLDMIRAAAAVEDPPGYAQNHFTSVSDLKPGWFRKLTLAASLWGIKELVTRLYRPGFVLDLGTIHFARWFRPPGAEKLVFFSNFDGSWLSYLEDFITKAHAGQSAAWSNGIGFPRTRFLILDGAQDGDRFKRWVRRQQAATQFWYARFETLAADAKRANALIQFGLARASDESQARDWLAQFGSLARPDAALENEEVQSIVFRGFRGLPHALFVPVRFPKDRARLKSWLTGLAGASGRPEAGGDGLAAKFGDNPFHLGESGAAVAFVAFSANGLERLGFPAGREDAKSTGFPSAFNLGMFSRARVLGDFGASSPAGWRWSDDESGADALLIVHGSTPEACLARLRLHEAVLGAEAVLRRIASHPTKDREGYEPFGFRDGLSQPVIKGTRRFARGASARDATEPGEFILGYRNNSGYLPLTPTVPATLDPSNRLPMLESEPRSGIPELDAPTALRDFGRNGAFLAVRQLSQDVDAFHREAAKAADRLRSQPGLQDVVGAEISGKWVEAKLMGRWQNGSSLLERPPEADEPPRSDHAFDNDFDFGSDDPEGFRCPLGSHIRRANPRGGLGPGDPVEQTIVNRHRILRRGRPYAETVPGSDKTEEGLVFVAVCADIERQFEFVQQSWINAPGFLNLRGEPDPIASAYQSGARRSFTIPTPSGPICLAGLPSFVETKGGGYFFLPSLSALLFLADLVSTRDAPALAGSD